MGERERCTERERKQEEKRERVSEREEGNQAQAGRVIIILQTTAAGTYLYSPLTLARV